jgi:hypothetical protein
MAATKTTDVWAMRIDRMVTWDTGWATPGAVSVDLHGNRWLSGGYALHKRPTRTATMKVELRDDGFHIRPPVGYEWEPSDYVPGPEGAFRVVGSAGAAGPGARDTYGRRWAGGNGGSGGGGGGGGGRGDDPRPVPPPPETERLPGRATIREVPRLGTTEEDDRLLPKPAKAKPAEKFVRGERG